jgi:mannitol operon transcriptional antiterminator
MEVLMNTILSSREKKIIVSIIESAGSITLQHVAQTIGVSRRTILRDISNVYSWFESRGVSVDRTSNKGISVELSEVKKTELLYELNQEDIVPIYTKRERMLYIVTELLHSSEVLKLAYFSTSLEVSEATISGDLNSVETWLNEYDLTLERKQGLGVHVEGKERNKRRALINIMYEMLDDSELRSVVKRQIGLKNPKQINTSKISSKLLNLMDTKTITTIEETIMESEEEMGFTFTESSYTALAVHLSLALKRIMNHEMIKMNENILEDLKLYDEYIIAAQLIQTLRKKTGLNIPDDEIGYVTLHIKGARYKNGMTETSILQFNEIIISNYELTSMINKMINVASQRTGYDLKKVDSLLIGLVDHIRPAISRIQLNLEIRNPLLEKIKDQFPEIYDISIECSKVITDKIGAELPDAEIGYIAMHIGSAVEQIKNKEFLERSTYNIVVTCISGIGTSKMLAERIKKEFKNITIVDIFSSTSLKDQWLVKNKIDLIVSTVYFDHDTIPVVTVNPLLLEGDITKLNQKLQSLKILNHKEKPKEITSHYEHLQKLNQYILGIIELLEHFTIQTNLSFTSYDDLIDHIAEYMTTDKNTLKQEIIRREEIGKIVFKDDHVGFIHTRSTTIDVIKIGVFRTKNYIQVDEDEIDTVLVLLAPKEVSKEKLEIIGEISSSIVTQESFLHDLRYMAEEDLYHQVESFLYHYYTQLDK